MNFRNRTIPMPRCAGFTLIEVLVSLLILAVGLLGLLGIFVASMQNNKSANLRTVATLQAQDMADRMRVNIGALTVIAPTIPFYHLPAATQNAACYTATCTSQQMAQNDYYEWNNSASATSNPSVLPGGYGVVCLDSTPNDAPPLGTWDGTTVNHGCDGLGTSYAIKLWWLDDRRSGTAVTSTAAYLRFVTTLQPQP